MIHNQLGCISMIPPCSNRRYALERVDNNFHSDSIFLDQYLQQRFLIIGSCYMVIMHTPFLQNTYFY